LRLIADIGGTNARFALADGGGGIEAVARLPVADHETFLAAAEAYLSAHAASAAIGEAVLAGAGPVRHARLQLTNAPWLLDAGEIAAAFGGASVRLVNDLEAVALALPYLAAEDLLPVGGATRSEETLPRLVVNVGTGLGAAVAIARGGVWDALATEAGHMRFAAANDTEAAFLETTQTYEELLSGPGLKGLQASGLSEAKIVTLFSSLLGRIAGDLVLATGAWGGLYFCGGVLDSWDRWIDADSLLKHLRDKGPMEAAMAAVPVHRIAVANPALIGLARASLP